MTHCSAKESWKACGSSSICHVIVTGRADAGVCGRWSAAVRQRVRRRGYSRRRRRRRRRGWPHRRDRAADGRRGAAPAALPDGAHAAVGRRRVLLQRHRPPLVHAERAQGARGHSPEAIRHKGQKVAQMPVERPQTSSSTCSTASHDGQLLFSMAVQGLIMDAHRILRCAGYNRLFHLWAGLATGLSEPWHDGGACWLQPSVAARRTSWCRWVLTGASG